MLLSLAFVLVQAADDQAAEKADEKAAVEAVEEFRKAFKGREEFKLAAIEELGKVQHLKTANRLAEVLAGHESGAVRKAAAKALGGYARHKKTAATVLSSALVASTKEPGVFAAICSALEELKEPGTAAALVRLFDDREENIARQAIETSGKVGGSGAIDALIALLGRSERTVRNADRASGVVVTDPATGKQYVSGPETKGSERARVMLKAANGALKEITKEPITTSDAWSAWWARNRETFDRK